MRCIIATIYIFVSGVASYAGDLSSIYDKWTANLCSGQCAVSGFIGRQLNTDLAEVTGVEGNFVAPLSYRFGSSYFVSAALSRRLIDIDKFASVELEFGAGQRFGKHVEQEVWSAIYFRWNEFPWNDLIKTTVAISTGLNYATGSPYEEVLRSQTSRGSKLMHYLSPEVTFSRPSSPDWQLVLRLHHRSGGRNYWGDTRWFKGTTGGIQYLSVGLRHWF